MTNEGVGYSPEDDEEVDSWKERQRISERLNILLNKGC
jgi:hypothetical protein